MHGIFVLFATMVLSIQGSAASPVPEEHAPSPVPAPTPHEHPVPDEIHELEQTIIVPVIHQNGGTLYGPPDQREASIALLDQNSDVANGMNLSVMLTLTL